MRLLYRFGPRPVALLLMPVLAAAGALQPEAELRSAHSSARMTATSIVSPVALGGVGVPSATLDVLPQDPVGGLAVAASAQATRSHVGRAAQGDQRPTGSTQQRGREALRTLDYDWRELDYRIEFRRYTGGALGTANRRTRVITVYVKPGQSTQSLRVSLAHELGHALDFEHGNDERRGSYRRIRGLSTSSSWFPCNRCTDYSSPAGDFAEVFAYWLAGPGDFRSRLQGPPDARQLEELAPLFRRPTPTPAKAQARPASGPEPDAEPEPDRGPTAGLPLVLEPSPTPRAHGSRGH